MEKNIIVRYTKSFRKAYDDFKWEHIPTSLELCASKFPLYIYWNTQQNLSNVFGPLWSKSWEIIRFPLQYDTARPLFGQNPLCTLDIPSMGKSSLVIAQVVSLYICMSPINRVWQLLVTDLVATWHISFISWYNIDFSVWDNVWWKSLFKHKINTSFENY